MSWTSEWPTELGWYWFYGDPYSKNPDPKHVLLHPVKVNQGANALIYVTGNSFMYKSEASKGLWKPMIVPEEPK
jgi:hypothetical protein